ncbi:hypothetical protein ARMGADRAFT_586422 [Armillaria gallica]|uniref:Uncharacterized protein n=1 Tax=Armillaria gallica TaxID=47427 RepID=A0A2H3E694_ARMGA|nr:hypothetical protein ARMGADRAFT_586422 [Armillaria gallica]
MASEGYLGLASAQKQSQLFDLRPLHYDRRCLVQTVLVRWKPGTVFWRTPFFFIDALESGRIHVDVCVPRLRSHVLRMAIYQSSCRVELLYPSFLMSSERAVVPHHIFELRIIIRTTRFFASQLLPQEYRSSLRTLMARSPRCSSEERKSPRNSHAARFYETSQALRS